ncbi:progonadoliberin-1-like [Salminus brasiliensis]|uniref:progonadoliberin-1-like n=1 Tax=Salminus brasiliensis TaxID=930266 RepID=UPI003B8335B2
MKVRNALLGMMVCVAVLQVNGQHWSYGLSPGGRRAVESLVGPLPEIIDDVPKIGPSSYLYDYVDDSPRNKLSRLKELLASPADRGSRE